MDGLTLTFVIFTVACFASVAVAEPRIVGGEVMTIEQYPSIVQVEKLLLPGGWRQVCGGSIVNSRWIVSAAHCFSGILSSTISRRIRAGSSFRHTGGQVIGVVADHKHPSSGLRGFDGDLTVVELEHAVVYNDAVQYIGIIAQGFILPDNLPVIYAGWGSTIPEGQFSEELRHVTVSIINNDLCRTRYEELYPGGFLPVTKNMICTGIPDVGGKDACLGDAGGPLYYRDAIDTLILVGVASWGHSCANETYPTVSTAISSYTDWITETAVIRYILK